ncbi:MAG: hypothetical protein ABSH51_23485 [Solirubrobacteraceae bacterium]
MPPPGATPPLAVLEEVPVAPGFVAGLVPVPVAELLEELLVVGVEELVEVLEVLVELVVVDDVLDVDVTVVGVQLRARSLTVEAPWPRSCSSVWLTEEGRSATALVSELAALAA